MTRQEYISELNANLMSLPDEERTNAVRFYEEYFDDAGAENEQTVIEELGKPFALAKSIICEQSEYSKSKSYAKYRESKAMEAAEPDAPAGEPDAMPNGRTQEAPHTQYTAYNYGANEQTADNTQNNNTSGSYNTAYDNSYENYKENYRSSAEGNAYGSYSQAPNDSAEFIVKLLVGIIVLLPLILMLMIIFFMCGMGAIGCLIGAVVLIAVGVPCFLVSFGAGMLALGIVILLVGAALLLLIPAVLGFGKFTPWVFKSIVKFFKKYSKGVI